MTCMDEKLVTLCLLFLKATTLSGNYQTFAGRGPAINLLMKNDTKDQMILRNCRPIHRTIRTGLS